MFCTLPLPSDQIPRFLAELAQKIILLICVKFPREKVALVPFVSFNAFASLLIPYWTKSRNTKILVQDLCTLPCVLASETASDVCTCVHCTGAGIDQCHMLCSFFFCCWCCYKQRHTISLTRSRGVLWVGISEEGLPLPWTFWADQFFFIKLCSASVLHAFDF